MHYFALQERRIPGKIFPNVSRPFLRFLKWVLNGRKCTGNNAKGGDLRGGKLAGRQTLIFKRARKKV